MMSSMPSECEELLVSGYVLGNLSPAEAVLFEEILADNPELVEKVTALQESLELAYFPEELTPPPSLKEKIIAASNQDNRDIEIANTNLSRFRSNWQGQFSWRKALGVISIVVVLGLGITNYMFWQTIQQASSDKRQQQNSEQEIYSLHGVNTPAKAKLVVNPTALNASLTVSNLSPLPPDQIYALWTVVGKDAPFTTDAKGAILTEVFQVREEGEITKNILLPPVHRDRNQIQKIAITIETATAPQAHNGSILISTQ